MTLRLLVLSLALLTMGVPGGALAEGHVEQEARAIARLLKCPVCQNLSVADSPAPLAQQMRQLIRQRLEAGQSREAILAYFVGRYGEEVLLDPPKAGFNGLLWWGAAAMPLGGLLLVALRLRRWLRQRPAAPAEAPLSEAERRAYEALLERELEQPGGSRA